MGAASSAAGGGGTIGTGGREGRRGARSPPTSIVFRRWIPRSYRGARRPAVPRRCPSHAQTPLHRAALRATIVRMSPAARSRRAPASAGRRPWLPLALLAVLVVAVYAPVAQHQLVHWDDDKYILENPMVLSGLTGHGIAWAFTAFHEGTWQPLTWLSYMTDVTLFGPGPRGFHLVNLLLHFVATVLLFLLVRRWMAAGVNTTPAARPQGSAPGATAPTASTPPVPPTWPAFVVAALFAVHPLNVEPVAWVASRKDLLAALFSFAALLAYARHRERPTAQTMSAVAGLFVLGLLSKPVVMTLPLVLLLLDLAPPWGTPARAALREKLPLFVLSIASLVVTYLAQRQVGAVSSLESVPLGQRVAIAAVSVWAYLRDAILPLRLAAFYPRVEIAWGVAAAALAGLVAVTVLVFRLRRRWPFLFFGWLWFGIVLLPMSGLVQIGSHARADRFAYLPMVGVFVAVVGAVIAWCGSGARAAARSRGALVFGGAVLLAFTLLAHRQVRVWRDDFTLFRHALRVTRANYLAHTKLGAALAQSGRKEEALAHFTEVLRISPGYLDGIYNYATVLSALGRRADSIAEFERGLALKPGDPRLTTGLARTWNNRGVDEATAGRLQEAIHCFEQAARIDPTDADARTNLARARAALGAPPPALDVSP